MLFLDKTCTISSVSIVNVNGSQKKVFTPIYTSIACDFRTGTEKNFEDSNISRDTDLKSYEVVIEPTKINVRNGMYIELIDPSIGTQGTYIIEKVQVFQDRSRINNNIYLIVRQR